MLEELGAVRDDTGANLVKDRDRRSSEIGGRLDHERRYGSDQHCLRHTLRAVVGYIARDLATARGMADMDGILQIEFLNELPKVVGVRVHLVCRLLLEKKKQTPPFLHWPVAPRRRHVSA